MSAAPREIDKLEAVVAVARRVADAHRAGYNLDEPVEWLRWHCLPCGNDVGAYVKDKTRVVSCPKCGHEFQA